MELNGIVQMNYVEYSEEFGIAVDTLRKRYAERFGKGFNRYAEIPQEIMFDTDASTEGKEAFFQVVPSKEEGEDKPYDPSDDEEDTPLKKLDFPISVLDVINIAECTLILYGCYVLIGWTGFLVGGMAVAFYLDTIWTVKKADAWASSDFGLFVAAMISIVAGFLHYVTFKTLLGYSKADLPITDTWTAIILSVVVSGISFSAILQSRNKTQDGL